MMEGVKSMIALTGSLGIVIAYLIAGYMGYCLGVQRGIEKCRTSRYRRK